jgi:hypothetical protein
MPENIKLIIGRIVHIQYGDGCRPAIVTGVRSKPNDEEIQYLDVTEFRQYDLPQVIHNVPPGPIANGWHWPMECLNATV